MIFVKNSRGGREGGQHDQHCVKNKFVKNRGEGGGSGSTSIWIMSVNILFVCFDGTPKGKLIKHLIERNRIY